MIKKSTTETASLYILSSYEDLINKTSESERENFLTRDNNLVFVGMYQNDYADLVKEVFKTFAKDINGSSDYIHSRQAFEKPFVGMDSQQFKNHLLKNLKDNKKLNHAPGMIDLKATRVVVEIVRGVGKEIPVEFEESPGHYLYKYRMQVSVGALK
jgi:hypothetical protein